MLRNQWVGLGGKQFEEGGPKCLEGGGSGGGIKSWEVGPKLNIMECKKKIVKNSLGQKKMTKFFLKSKIILSCLPF